jgi:hypothetical protein
MRVEPAVVGVAAFVALANFDHDVLFAEALRRGSTALRLEGTGGTYATPRIILVITTIVKRYIARATANAGTLLFLWIHGVVGVATSQLAPFPRIALWV